MRSSLLPVVLLAAACLALGYWVGARPSAAPAPGSSYLQQLEEGLSLRPEQVAVLAHLLQEQDDDLRRLVADKQRELQEPVAERVSRFEQELLAQLDEGQRRQYAELTAPVDVERR